MALSAGDRVALLWLNGFRFATVVAVSMLAPRDRRVAIRTDSPAEDRDVSALALRRLYRYRVSLGAEATFGVWEGEATSGAHARRCALDALWDPKMPECPVALIVRLGCSRV